MEDPLPAHAPAGTGAPSCPNYTEPTRGNFRAETHDLEERQGGQISVDPRCKEGESKVLSLSFDFLTTSNLSAFRVSVSSPVKWGILGTEPQRVAGSLGSAHIPCK